MTYSCDPSARNVHSVSVSKQRYERKAQYSNMKGRKEGKVTYRSIRLHGPVELHRRPTLFRYLRVLAVQPALLVLLHARNLLLEPLSRPLVLLLVACRRQLVRRSCLLLDMLPPTHVRADDSRVTDNLHLPFTVDQAFDAQDALTRFWPETDLAVHGRPTAVSRRCRRQRSPARARNHGCAWGELKVLQPRFVAG